MKLRVEYRLGPELKFLSNLDMMRLTERALRRAKVPFALSAGFNPHIKLSMGTVLPVGLWGEKEYMDLEVKQPVRCEEFIATFNNVLPAAMQVNSCVIIDDKAPALMKIINAAAYTFIVQEQKSKVALISGNILNQEKIVVKSRGKNKDKNKDLRPGIYNIDFTGQENAVAVNIWVSVGTPVNIRYDELYDLLIGQGIKEESVKDVYRSGNYIYDGTEFFSPLEKVI